MDDSTPIDGTDLHPSRTRDSSLPIRSRAILAAMVVVLLCTGCAFRRHVAGMAIEHNDFVAQTTNRQTVLNILRAREREPMHFTSFASVSGKAQGTARVGFNTSVFAGDPETVTNSTVTKTGTEGALIDTSTTRTRAETLNPGVTSVTPSAEVSVTTGTDFILGVEASEKFYRGIMGPLSPGIVSYYLRQGFPPDLLSHLVIRRIEIQARITGPDGRQHQIPLGAFDNSPDELATAQTDEERSQAGAFEELMRCWQLSYNLIPAPSPAVGPPEVRDFALALAATGDQECEKETELRQSVASWWRAQPAPMSRQSPGQNAPPFTPSIAPATGTIAVTATPPNDREQVTQGVGGSGLETLYSGNFFNGTLPSGYRGEIIIYITLRSVEGILYYLGEYVRNPDTSPKLRYRTCPEHQRYCLPIIRIVDASQVRPDMRFVDLTYRGNSYAVPMAGRELNADGGRSSQAISLVQQLLNLHRSAADLPGVIRVVN